jgi:putative spermidine/putrescine transport system ATP-binding protein
LETVVTQDPDARHRTSSDDKTRSASGWQVETRAEPDARSGSQVEARAEPKVRFIGVGKSFDGETLVVRDLNLDIMPGEFLTLLGPSGSGKTTTLMMLAGFEQATAGEILLAGKPITRVPPYRRNIGVVFQNYALFPHMTAAENLAFPLEVRRRSRTEIAERVQRALAIVSLTGFDARLPAQLSGGQQQRVAVARALVFDPALVLMDEPLGALDKQLREQMQYEIKHLHERLGITVVYVTHDQTEALTMSDRIAVFDRGAIQQIAAPAELYEAPRSSFVARFVGENNSPSGRVLARSGGTCRVALDSGGEVEAVPVRAEAPGERTTLSIRPERVLIDPGPQVATRLQGRVRELVYLGDHLRACIAVGAKEFIVKIPNTRRVPLGVGDAVTIGWDTADCRALDPVEPTG